VLVSLGRSHKYLAFALEYLTCIHPQDHFLRARPISHTRARGRACRACTSAPPSPSITAPPLAPTPCGLRELLLALDALSNPSRTPTTLQTVPCFLLALLLALLYATARRSSWSFPSLRAVRSLDEEPRSICGGLSSCAGEIPLLSPSRPTFLPLFSAGGESFPASQPLDGALAPCSPARHGSHFWPARPGLDAARRPRARRGVAASVRQRKRLAERGAASPQRPVRAAVGGSRCAAGAPRAACGQPGIPCLRGLCPCSSPSHGRAATALGAACAVGLLVARRPSSSQATRHAARRPAVPTIPVPRLASCSCRRRKPPSETAARSYRCSCDEENRHRPACVRVTFKVQSVLRKIRNQRLDPRACK
jgi:hypothetical protein